jgi:hypothetical protein
LVATLSPSVSPPDTLPPATSAASLAPAHVATAIPNNQAEREDGRLDADQRRLLPWRLVHREVL